MKFGIDLVGGTYITLAVQSDKAVKNELLSQLNSVKKSVQRGDMGAVVSSKVEDAAILITFDSNQAAMNAERELSGDKEYLLRVTGNTLEMRLADGRKKEIEKWAVDGTVDVLRTRLNALGVEEITIARRGENNIIVELPDVQDPVQAKKMIGTPALLEFKIVELDGNRPVIGRSKEDIIDQFDGELPEGTAIYEGKTRGEGTSYYLLPDYAEVTGHHLRDARPNMSSQGMRPGWGVSFSLSREGGDRFGELTRNNLNRLMAVLIDNKVIQVATINDEIHSEGQITGDFKDSQAKELSLLLKTGTFVAPVTFEEERRVGPSLGYDSIMSGLLACLVGLGMLLIFSLFYYKLSGLFAFFALIYNLILVLLALAWFKAALTLPGIAGMVLTTGMAIDSSILIYERIKELIRAGEPIKKAVKVGFSNATVVILDANITTFLVGIVLYKFGTGPIRGFAITMMIGIISTLITGFFFLKSIFSCWLAKNNVQKLSI